MRRLNYHPPWRHTGRRAAAALAATSLVLAGGVAALGPGTSSASSHKEAPLIAADPAADTTDVYAFVSPDRPGYVTFIANWIPFQEPNGGPNFYPFATDAAYNINVDSDGDGKPNAAFRWSFKNDDRRGGDTFLYNNGPVTSLDDPNLLFRQSYNLEASFNGGAFQTRVSNVPVAPSRVGRTTMPNYSTLRQQATKTLPGGWKIFAGQADDPFFIALEVFDGLSSFGSRGGNDTVAGYNVNTIALQVPFADVALKGDVKRNPVIGVWATTDRAKVRITGTSPSPTGIIGPRVQVSRLGNPLINEVIASANLKDGFNASRPDQDAQNTALVNRVLDPELARLIQGIYGIPAPATPRNDIAQIFLYGISNKSPGPIKLDLNSQLNNADVDPTKFVPSEQLRLNMGTPATAKPARLGLLAGDQGGFPNGRRLADDVVDIESQVVMGAAQTGKLVDGLKNGDRVDANDNPFLAAFPYVALPNVDAVNLGGGSSGTAARPTASSKPAAMPAADSGRAAGDSLAVKNAAQQAAGDRNQDLVNVAAVSIGGATVLSILAALGFYLVWYRRRFRT